LSLQNGRYNRQDQRTITKKHVIFQNIGEDLKCFDDLFLAKVPPCNTRLSSPYQYGTGPISVNLGHASLT